MFKMLFDSFFVVICMALYEILFCDIFSASAKLFFVMLFSHGTPKISNYFYGIIKWWIISWQFSGGKSFAIGVLCVSKNCHLSGPRIDGKEWIVRRSNRRRARVVFRFDFGLFHVTMVNTFMVT